MAAGAFVRHSTIGGSITSLRVKGTKGAAAPAGFLSGSGQVADDAAPKISEVQAEELAPYPPSAPKRPSRWPAGSLPGAQWGPGHRLSRRRLPPPESADASWFDSYLGADGEGLRAPPSSVHVVDWGDVVRELPPGPRVCVLAGVRFQHEDTAALVRAVARRFADTLVGQAVVLTRGTKGVQETFATCLGGFPDLRHLVVRGTCSDYFVGRDVPCGETEEEQAEIFGQLGDVYLAFDDGPTCATEAETARRAGAVVLPLSTLASSDAQAPSSDGLPPSHDPEVAAAEVAQLAVDTVLSHIRTLSQREPVLSVGAEHVFRGDGRPVPVLVHDDNLRGATSDLPTVGPYTLEAWVRPAAEAGMDATRGAGAVVSWGRERAKAANFLRLLAKGTLSHGWLGPGACFSAELPAGFFADGAFHHIAATWDGEEVKLFADFQQVTGTLASGYKAVDRGTFRIGQGVGGTETFRGAIRGVRIWKAALRPHDLRAADLRLRARDEARRRRAAERWLASCNGSSAEEMPIHAAARSGEWEVTWGLLEVSAPAPAPSPLPLAVDDGLALALREEGLRPVSVDHRLLQSDSLGSTPLHYAVLGGPSELVRLLLDGTVDPARTNGDGNAPLHLACMQGRADVVGELLASPRVDLDLRGQYGWTPLQAAAYHRRLDVLELLVERRADASALTADPETSDNGPGAGSGHAFQEALRVVSAASQKQR